MLPSLRRSTASRRLHTARYRLERALGTPHHHAGSDIEERGMPLALQASVVGHMALPERGEMKAAAVRNRNVSASARVRSESPRPPTPVSCDRGVWIQLPRLPRLARQPPQMLQPHRMPQHRHQRLLAQPGCVPHGNAGPTGGQRIRPHSHARLTLTGRRIVGSLVVGGSRSPAHSWGTVPSDAVSCTATAASAPIASSGALAIH